MSTRHANHMILIWQTCTAAVEEVDFLQVKTATPQCRKALFQI